jgi:endonuclease-3
MHGLRVAAGRHRSRLAGMYLWKVDAAVPGSIVAMPSGPDRPSTPAQRRRAHALLGRLAERYGDMGTALCYRSPWQLLVATVLSAQTTDANVNRVTPVLFSRWPEPSDLASADPEEVEKVVYATGYYRQKARAIVALSRDLEERFGGGVPADLDALVALPGVGRKTASVVLAEAFGLPAIAVDTHVGRVSRRLGLSTSSDPIEVERDLQALYPKDRWVEISGRFIHFGRDVCLARRPRCWQCPLEALCPYPDKSPGA